MNDSQSHPSRGSRPEGRKGKDDATRPSRTEDKDVVNVTVAPVGIYGWRKYCLYATVLVLLCLVIINMGLIVYLWRILDVNSSGAGALHFSSNRCVC